ncbi:hypothetical protein [Agrobacterium rubi]|uniref:Uncharacterized protein n=1 Tax=Agrobacterium rubi TaxID=28099 RepID=A0AAE7USU9_9HYPH|nr:hypothetical protein [Agrobacterium rubi]NTE88760.1 hypothetical protein [Agrobacterium rubi]NTF04588.1 hypothetical protein [Agrobacterium rubi]NTF39150.1 hypothetical protein [Agrobacterium rubi]OCJ51334.1 hypothetical protein A6U92_06900 [Agrobacterium rubi]QTG02801.1 hypothetical protein G6M88_20725 [Agrobacterium rubi]
MTSEPATKVRPTEPADVTQIADLFSSVFRTRSKPNKAELAAYLSQLMFSHPNYTPENGSIVSVDGAGRVKSTLIILPISYRIGDEPVTARLACAFMAANDANPRSIAALIFQLRPRGHQISFSDSAAPVSVSHLKAIGGTELPVQGLRWYKIFKPLPSAVNYVRRRISQKYPKLLHPGSLPVPIAIAPTVLSSGYSVASADTAVYAQYANQFLSHCTVAPIYSAEHLDWTITASCDADGRGRLVLAQVQDENGDLCGLFSFVGARGGEVQVLDLLWKTGQQDSVVDAVFESLKAAGFSFVSAQLRPEIIPALSRHKDIWYRHVTGVSATSRSPEFKQAMQNGQAYIGGVAGESWSRLVHDFY